MNAGALTAGRDGNMLSIGEDTVSGFQPGADCRVVNAE